MRLFFLIIIFAFKLIKCEGQIFGGTPSSQKWKQTNTDTARIIFAPGLEAQANRAASIIHYMAANKPATLGNKLKKINVVLQHQTVVPNAYVGLGPFRSEFFMVPEMNNFSQGSVSWTDQLALHEYRHVQQFNNFNNGISSVMKVLFGEEGYAVAINAAVPDWFFEGDAVVTETILSQQGRGRLPHFLNAYPALWQSNKKYSWMKLRNGSLKDYVPSHYHLGYLLVNYGRQKYGDSFWAKVTKDASAFKGLVYPFQAAIKRYTGIDYKTFIREAFRFYKGLNESKIINIGYPGNMGKNAKSEIQDLKGVSQQKINQATTDGLTMITKIKKSYLTNYYFPYGIGNDSLLYLKTTLRHRPAFYFRDNRGEHKLKVRDISIDEQFSYRNGKIVYAAYETDARWGWRDYSVIKILDIKTRKQQAISTKSKYFTPDISEDGSKIVAVYAALNGKSELHILNSQNGKLIKTIQSAEIMQFTDPKFLDNDKLVTAVRFNDGRMALALAEISTGNTIRLTSPSFNVIGYPCISGDLIYFSASYTGNDDVFALNHKSKKIYKITNGSLGNYQVNVADGKITWSALTSEGYQLMQMEGKDIVWKELSIPEEELLHEKFIVSKSEKDGDVLSGEIDQRAFDFTRYKKSTKLINFHSWRPNYDDPVFTYSVYSQNVLNTFESELFYAHNNNEKVSSIGYNGVYSGFMPYLNIGTEYTFNREFTSGSRLLQWDQLDSRFGVSLPLNKTKGQTFRNFTISSFYVLRNEFSKGFLKDSIGNTSFSYLSHALSWSQQTRRTVQQLFPRWGYALSGTYRHAISLYDAHQVYTAASLYLPGFATTHCLVVTAALQQRDTSRATFSSRIANARGFSDYYRTNAGSKMWRLSANYNLPLWITDWGVANIMYVHRLRANLFYDYQRVFFNNRKNYINMRSAGVEIYADTRWWNQHPFTFGVRFSFLQTKDLLSGNPKGSSLFEIVVPVSLIPR